jgi:hypothetical protein
MFHEYDKDEEYQVAAQQVKFYPNECPSKDAMIDLSISLPAESCYLIW